MTNETVISLVLVSSFTHATPVAVAVKKWLAWLNYFFRCQIAKFRNSRDLT